MRTNLRRIAAATTLAAGAVFAAGAGTVAGASSLPSPSYTLAAVGPGGGNCTVEASNQAEFVPGLEFSVSGLGTGVHAVAAWTDGGGFIAATIDGNSGSMDLGSHSGTVNITEVVEYADATMTTVQSFLTGPASIVLSPCSGTQGWMGPYVGISSTSDGLGYWIASDGGYVLNYGDAPFWGSFPLLFSPPGAPQYLPVIGVSGTPDGKGYWMAGYDGSLFAYGDARFYGSMGSAHLNKPIVGMASTADRQGYWLVASDGGIFAFGDASLPRIDRVVPPPQSTDRRHGLDRRSERLLAGRQRRRHLRLRRRLLPRIDGWYLHLNQPIMGMATWTRWSWLLDGRQRRWHLRLRRRLVPRIDGWYSPQSTDRGYGAGIKRRRILDGRIRRRCLRIR